MINSAANPAVEIGQLIKILQGVQDAATTALSSRKAWPEEVALAVCLAPVNVYPETIEVVPAVGCDQLLERGVRISGTLAQVRNDAGILGEKRLPSVAQAMYAAMVLDTITLPQLATLEAQGGPGANFTCKRGRFNTTGGDGGTQIVFVADWTLTLVLKTGYLLHDPDVT